MKIYVPATTGTAMDNLKRYYEITENHNTPLLTYYLEINGKSYEIVNYGFEGDHAFMEVK